MAIQFKNYSTLWGDLLRYLNDEGRGIPLTAIVEGGRFYTFLRAVAALHADGWSALQAISESFYVSTAEGEMLDKRIGDFGMVRFAGQAASGPVMVTPTSPAYRTTIPAGTTFATRDGVSVYVLDADLVLTGGTDVVTLRALEVGTVHNRSAGTTLVDQAGRWTNLLTFTVGDQLDDQGSPQGAIQGGSDIESDDAVKARFADFIKSLGKGTLLAVRTGIREHAQVRSVVLQDAVPAPGYITAWVYSHTIPMSTTTREEILTNLKNWRCGGIRVKLMDVDTVEFDISVSLKVHQLLAGTGDQATFNESVRLEVEAALQTLITNLSLGQSLHRTDIMRTVSAIEGVASVTVVLPAADTLGVNLIEAKKQYRTVLKPTLLPLVVTTDTAGPARTSQDDYPAPEEFDC